MRQASRIVSDQPTTAVKPFRPGLGSELLPGHGHHTGLIAPSVYVALGPKPLNYIFVELCRIVLVGEDKTIGRVLPLGIILFRSIL